jgi:CO dehydrogenase/acetyl-CoA synthase alpha subunit
MFGVVLEIQQPRLEAGVAFQGAPLRTSGTELIDDYAHGHTGAAAVAIGAISESATATEAGSHELAVYR